MRNKQNHFIAIICCCYYEKVYAQAKFGEAHKLHVVHYNGGFVSALFSRSIFVLENWMSTSTAHNTKHVIQP